MFVLVGALGFFAAFRFASSGALGSVFPCFRAFFWWGLRFPCLGILGFGAKGSRLVQTS